MRIAISLATLAVLGVAAPAEATLLVRSDGAGLLIQDKNGISDNADMFSTTLSGQTAYRIRNLNDGDVFKFDRQTGCQETNSFTVTCQRNGSAINVALAGGNDFFNMSGTPVGQSSVAAGAGNDEVIGHTGRDNLNGGTGDDDFKGAGGNDSLDGRDGNDRLDGGGGNDSIDGDDGSDTLIGSSGTDILRGLAGNDSIFAREAPGTTAATDTVTCGSGSDFAEVDLKDAVSSSCEEKDVAAVGETPNVKILGKTLGVSRTGRVRVRLRCPRGVRSLGCNGRLQLRVGRNSAGASRSRRVRYRIRAGRRKTVTLQLTARDVRTLRSQQRRGRRSRGVLTSVERGRKGAKTTTRNPRLRLR